MTLIVPSQNDIRHDYISHIISFSGNAGAFPVVSNSLFFLDRTDWIWYENKSVRRIGDILHKVHAGSIGPKVYRAHSEFFFGELKKCFDFTDRTILDSNFHIFTPGFISPNHVKKNLPDDAVSYQLSDDFYNVNYISKSVSKGSYLITENITHVTVDNHVNQYLDDDNIVWLHDSVDHLSTVCEHYIKWKKLDMDVEELKTMLINKPISVLRELYKNEIDVADISSVKIEPKAMKNVYYENCFIVDIKKILFSDNIQYYKEFCDLLRLEPNIVLYDRLRSQFNGDDWQNFLFGKTELTDWQWKLLEKIQKTT